MTTHDTRNELTKGTKIYLQIISQTTNKRLVDRCREAISMACEVGDLLPEDKQDPMM